MLSHFSSTSALIAGLLGTAVMTIVMYALPIVGIPRMDIMAALGSVFPLRISPYILGFLIHFGIGIVLAFIYAAFFHSWIPGPRWLKGALFSLLPWLFAITLLGSSLELASQIFGASSPLSTANPCAVANPCASKAAVNPCAPKTANPCVVANPCSVKTTPNPCAPQAVNPCAVKPANPCAAKAPANPCGLMPVSPSAPAANPCVPKTAAQSGIPPQLLSLVVHLIYGGVVGALYRSRV